MYLHRYLRLTPIVAVSILLYWKLLPHLSDGPLYGNWNFDNYDRCEGNWYWTLLYVQNYATDSEVSPHSLYGRTCDNYSFYSNSVWLTHGT